MEKWLKTRGFARQDDETDWDDSVWLAWLRDWDKKRNRKLRVSQQIFTEDGKLKHFDHNEWRAEWLEIEDQEKKQTGYDDLEDEIPF
jgi:hypothetical protein